MVEVGDVVDERRRPKVLAGVLLVAMLTGLLGSGLQLLLGVYRDPSLHTVLVEAGTTTLALGPRDVRVQPQRGRRRAREEGARRRSAHRADLALQSCRARSSG